MTNIKFIYFRHLYALETHLCIQKHMSFGIFASTTPTQLIPRPPKMKFSQDHLSCKKLNQFKPVLASGKNLKNLKFPPFCTNLTHIYFKFLKDFYIFRIHGPSGSLWYPWTQDSSSTNREKYCPQEMVVSM